MTIVTPFPNLGPYLFLTGEAFRSTAQLRAAGVEIIPSRVSRSTGPPRRASRFCAGRSGRMGGRLRRPRHPARALRTTLQRSPPEREFEDAGIEALYRIGDCVAPRLIADAIFDGHRLAREIDSHDPAEPLPYLREVASRAAARGWAVGRRRRRRERSAIAVRQADSRRTPEAGSQRMDLFALEAALELRDENGAEVVRSRSDPEADEALRASLAPAPTGGFGPGTIRSSPSPLTSPGCWLRSPAGVSPI